MNYSGTERLHVVPYNEGEYRDKHNPLFRVAKLARSIGSGIKENPQLSIIVAMLGGVAFYSGYLAMQVSREFDERFGTKSTKTPVTVFRSEEAAIFKQQLGGRNSGLWEVMSTEPTLIEVDVKDGINVRDARGAKVLTGFVEPYYNVESYYARNFLDYTFTRFVVDLDEHGNVKRISAARWIKDENVHNVGLGRLELMAVFDKQEGCLVRFSNPNATLCR